MSIPFGTLLGARLKIHIALLLTIPLAALLKVLPYYLMVFAVVLVHELSHSLAARCLHVEVQEIELAPFGGVARMAADLESMPGRESIIALAGPLSNLLMAMGAVLINYYWPLQPEQLSAFLSVNFLIAGFNMLPALPLDGGRIARAALSAPLGLERATRLVSGIGCVLGAAVLALGVYWAVQGVINLTFFITGSMLMLMAWREGRQATALYLRDATGRQRALYRDGALPMRQIAVSADTTVGEVAKRLSPRRYHRITLLNDRMEECGTLTETQVMRAVLSQQRGMPIGSLIKSRIDR